MDLSWCIRNLFTAIGNSWSVAHSSSSNYSPQLLRVRLLTVNLKFNYLHHVHRIILGFFAFSFERFFPFCQLDVFLSPFRVFSPTDFKIARFDVFGLPSKFDLVHHFKKLLNSAIGFGIWVEKGLIMQGECTIYFYH